MEPSTEIQLSIAEYHSNIIRHPVLINDMDSMIRRVVPTVVQKQRSRVMGLSRLFADVNGDELRGALWAGVPRVAWAGKGADGVWLFNSTNTRDDPPSKHYVRVAEGPDNEVWFAPVIWDRQEELQGSRTQTYPTIQCRVSYDSSHPLYEMGMVARVARLVEQDGRYSFGYDNQSFSLFLARVSETPCFMEAGLTSCQVEGLAASIMINWRTSDSERAELIRSALTDHRAVHQPGLSEHRLKPCVYNIVVPPRIFRLTQECFERNIVPMIPSYVWHGGHMFNGGWFDACTGEGLRRIQDSPSRKIISGLLNLFNTDLSSGVSRWPFPIDKSWFKAVEAGLETLLSSEMPDPTGHNRANLALHEARKVPCVMEGKRGTKWRIRLLDHDPFTHRVQMALCDKNGLVLAAEPPTNLQSSRTLSETPTPDASTNARCSYTFSDGSRCIVAATAGDGLAECYWCSEFVCGEHFTDCETCGIVCSACEANELHRCRPCMICEVSLSLESQYICAGCGEGVFCYNCREQHCPESCCHVCEGELGNTSGLICVHCGQEELCSVCVSPSEHECSEWNHETGEPQF